MNERMNKSTKAEISASSPESVTKASHHSCPVAAYLSITALPYLMLLPLICEYCVLPDTLESLAPLRH